MVTNTATSVTSTFTRSNRQLPPSGENDIAGCPECEGPSIGVADDGSEYCRGCGLVLSNVPVERSEPGWVPRSERRTGPAASVIRESVGTTIGTGDTPQVAARLNRYHNRLEYGTRALKDGLREVRSLCSALHVPNTTNEHAAHLYRQAFTANLLQGRSQEGIAAACVYVATRRYHQPVTLKDVAEVSPVKKSTISGSYRTVLQELGVDIEPPEPTDFLARIAAVAGVSYEVERRAAELLGQAVADQQHIGQSPAGVAAAALYAGVRACDEDVTQSALARAAGVSPVTLSRQWQSFSRYVD